MLTVQNIKDAFEKRKTDISDVGASIFLSWVQFTVDFVYQELKGSDPSRFVQKQLYSIVLPPHSKALPTNFQDLNQTNCGLFKYKTRKRKIVTFDSTGDNGVTYSDTGGTSSYNQFFYIDGDASRGFTADAAATLNLSFSTPIDWTDFQDSLASSPTNDYISVYVYVGNSVPTSATIEFSTLTDGSSVGINQFSYTTTDLELGWNQIKVLKSAFTTTGSPSWSSLGYLRLSYTGGSASTNIYWDKLELVESETNGKGETDQKIGMSWYGAKVEGYYLEGDEIVFTNASKTVDLDYMMKFIPVPPVLTGLSSYLTIDGTANTQEIIQKRHEKYMVDAIDVLYEQWDNNPTAESVADFRFVRSLGGLLHGYNRVPRISIMRNPSRGF